MKKENTVFEEDLMAFLYSFLGKYAAFDFFLNHLLAELISGDERKNDFLLDLISKLNVKDKFNWICEIWKEFSKKIDKSDIQKMNKFRNLIAHSMLPDIKEGRKILFTKFKNGKRNKEEKSWAEMNSLLNKLDIFLNVAMDELNENRFNSFLKKMR